MMTHTQSRKHISVCALTTGRNDPSARFRVRQHISRLTEYNIATYEYIPIIDKNAGIPSRLTPITTLLPQRLSYTLWRGLKLACHIPGIVASVHHDLVWLNRELLTGRYTLERWIKKPIVLDIDDAVWLAKPAGNETMRRLGSKAAAILAGNNHIANWFSEFNHNIFIIPTAIDTERFSPAPGRYRYQSNKPFAIGWSGLSSNYGYLLPIEQALAQFLNRHDAKLLIISDRPPAFRHIPAHRIDYRPWNPEVEATGIRDMDVGIMPLPDTPWARGKCSFKMLQYMSAAIPVVASPVGMNSEVFSHGLVGIPATTSKEWLDALTTIYNDVSLATTMGQNGRRIVLEQYSLAVISKKIANMFHTLV